MPGVDTSLLVDLCQRYSIRELSLFGSATRDDFTASSDVDVLVEFSPDARIGFFRFVELQEELEHLFGRRVDLVTERSLSPWFRDEVMREREVIYVQA